MIGLSISLRKPRAGEYQAVQPKAMTSTETAGIVVTIKNTRNTPVYLKWRI